MTIPPFPSQDLAKLVLGYLAEEQLMTAYDEFLQASPYLDALRNEYDRIFMTSLKIILAEYRAVKIYVETCKPFLLRKKLLQCSNILDVVKLLISYVDTNKLHSQDISSDRISLSKQDTSATSKQYSCDVCESLNLTSCNCQSKHSKPIGHSAKHVETSSLENSVETTALEDLPGNISNKKKHVRVLEKDTNFEPNLELSDNIRQSTSAYNTSNNGLNCYQSSLTKTNENASLDLSNVVKPTDTPECREKIEEFNKVLKKVCNKSNTDTRLFSVPESETKGGRVSNSNFQSFASEVNGNENRNVPVPDSSTSENSITLLTASKDNTTEVSAIQHEISKDINDQTGIQPSNLYPFPRLKPKSNEQKIKIISDIKVDSPFPTLNTATSTPLMQTIVINGTPAYKQKLPVANNSYTKDEIMAMPTIIVVPTSGPPLKGTQTQPALSQKIKKVKTKTTSSKKLLGPLVIDVSSSPVITTNKEKSSSQLGVDLQSSGIETGLVKTVDVTKNASVPKDNIIPGSTQTSTPQVVPPVRKSSSTPRRQHIRVLDFTTPRRILHENVCEKIPEESNEKSVEVIVTRSPNIVYPETNHCTNNIINMSTVKVHKIETCHITSSNEPSKKSNWDADLRALALSGEKSAQVVVKAKPKVRNSKKAQNKSNNLQENKETASTETKPLRNKRKTSPKGKKSKRRKLEEEEEQYNEILKTKETNIAVKPTFNIVTADSHNALQENSKAIDHQNKAHNEEIIETPEAERLSLQNEIGAKLNISDLLETPYKQALYDIQMETPKFLGSVLPDDPISDIKIMNIPTPRFFDTPKPIQTTPSYASRGTDYSSGGSYYKPDEQDYLRIPDLDCAVTSSKEVPNSVLSKDSDNNKKNIRPVRKCTKNVSYKAHTAKGKVIDDKSEIASSCSETASINSSYENSDETVKTLKTPRTPKVNKPKPHLKSEPKQKKEISKTRKSPIKKDKSNTFMKIKPRRPTPTKDNKRSRKPVLVNSPKSQTKKRTSGKEKYAQTTAVVAAPTKSRRKSSTPRKLHCTKQFNSESSVESPETNVTNTKIATRDPIQGALCIDSDTEQLALRWSDDGSQDSKPKAQDSKPKAQDSKPKAQDSKPKGQECEDISKIKEYIETSLRNKPDYNSGKCTLQVDLITRGFDAETAKIIERDLLDTPDSIDQIREMYAQISEPKQGGLVEKSADIPTKPVIDSQQEKESIEEDDSELSVYECNEESNNYICCHSETKDTLKGDPVTLRDAWSMEIFVDDGEAPIRLRATSFNSLFDNAPQDTDVGYSFKETEMAVSSISNMDKLYTPLKDHRTQCYEIFDSTLTSLDTPLKLSSPKELIHETTEIEIVVEEERIESRDSSDTNKRKRLHVSSSPEEASNEVKQTNSEAQFSFNPTNIQNIDIESVLKKLHGP